MAHAYALCSATELAMQRPGSAALTAGPAKGDAGDGVVKLADRPGTYRHIRLVGCRQWMHGGRGGERLASSPAAAPCWVGPMLVSGGTPRQAKQQSQTGAAMQRR